MAISNNTTGLRPGVCTSSTRPTAPYEGQMIYETDTDLTYIWGGSAWQQVSGGTAVGNSGLVYISSGSFSAAASFEATGLSSTYLYYKLVFSTIGSAASGTQAVLYSGATARNSLYYAGVGYAGYDNASGAANSSNSTAYFWAGQSSTAYRAQTSMEFRMKAGDQFVFTLQAFEGNTFRSIHSAGFRNATDTFDRIRFNPSTGTFTGEWRLYGYREA